MPSAATSCAHPRGQYFDGCDHCRRKKRSAARRRAARRGDPAPIEAFSSADLEDVRKARKELKEGLEAVDRYVDWMTRNRPRVETPQIVGIARAHIAEANLALEKLLRRHRGVLASKKDPPIKKYRPRKKK